MPPRLVLRSAVPAVRFVLVGSAVQALLQAGVFSGVYVVTGVCGDGGPYRKAAEEICCCDGARSGWRFWCECGCRCADGVGAADQLPVRGAGAWGGAVRVLRGRVDRGLAGVGSGEYERACYGSQYASTAPLFEHFGVTLWAP